MDPSEIYVCATALPEDAPDSNMVMSPSGAGSLAMPMATFWPNGKRLRVQFMRGGTEKVREKVMFYAQLWEKYENIDFQFVETGPADIRIAFDEGAGSWSFVGTNARTIPQDKPTMNFGWFHDDTREEEFSRTTIHEFGHALGCIHEHQSPNVKINWDVPKVYAYFEKPPNNWSKAKTDHNLLKPHDGKTTVASDYDERSVMLYFFPPSLTTDGKGTTSNHTLSPQDKLFISMMYPFQTRSSGTWSTSESRPWYPARPLNIKQVVFNTPYLEAPRIAIGLNELDIDESRNARVKAYSERVTEKDFVLRIDSWADSLLYVGGATWVEFEENDYNFQVGSYNLTKPNGAKNSIRVSFSQAFKGTPKVVVWLSGLDMHKDRNLRIKAYADQVDARGCVIHLDTWGDTVMYSASASWIAYDPNVSKTVSSGSDSTENYRSWFPAQKANGRTVPYGNRCQKLPQVYVAISSMDFDAATNVRFNVKATDIGLESFKWNVDTRSDTLCYKAGVDWIAFE